MTTEILLITVFVLLLTYTAFAGKMGVHTISKAMRDLAYKWSVVPFISGLLVAHWFWNVGTVLGYGWAYGLPVMGLLIVKDIFVKKSGTNSKDIWFQNPVIYLGVGFVMGILFWGLGKGA